MNESNTWLFSIFTRVLWSLILIEKPRMNFSVLIPTKMRTKMRETPWTSQLPMGERYNEFRDCAKPVSRCNAFR